MKKRSERDHWRILLAEDDEDAALLIELALGKASPIPVEVHRARNGHEALILVEDIFPDLILLDLNMPGPTGHEVLEAIKGDDELRKIPVAVLTSSERDEDVARSYGLGSNHFITKPKDPAELEARLRSLLNNLQELSSIRRGRGEMEATAVSALDASTVTARRFLIWLGVGVAVALLVLIADLTDV